MRCEKTDLLVTDCAHCRRSGTGVSARKVAEYKSVCTGCGDTISIGERIGHVNNNWVCPSCVREAQEH